MPHLEPIVDAQSWGVGRRGDVHAVRRPLQLGRVGRLGFADQLELFPVPELHRTFQVAEPGQANDVTLRVVVDTVPVGGTELEDGLTLAVEERGTRRHEPIHNAEVF